MERYAFLKVRRVRAPVPGGRKAFIFHGFAIPLENLKGNDAFGAFARWSLLLFPVQTVYTRYNTVVYK